MLLIATAAVGAGTAFAATTTTTPAATTTTPASGAHHWHRHGGGMLIGVMLRATHQLNLTSEQQTTIKGILSTARSQHKASQTPVDVFTLANPGDPNYATALQTARSAAATRLQNEADLQGQIYNVLTADQKAKLPQVLADMKTKAEQRRSAWLQQHPAAAAGSN